MRHHTNGIYLQTKYKIVLFGGITLTIYGYKPAEGNKNLFAGLLTASFSTLESCAMPSDPSHTKVNIISKSHIASTFWKHSPCSLSLYGICLSIGITTRMRVSSRVPTTPCIEVNIISYMTYVSFQTFIYYFEIAYLNNAP